MVDTVRCKQSHALPPFLVLFTVPLGCSWNESFTSVGAEYVEFCKLSRQTIKTEEGVVEFLTQSWLLRSTGVVTKAH